VRVAQPTWFTDKVLLRTISDSLPAPLNHDLPELLNEPLTWQRDHGRFLRGKYIDANTHKLVNFTVYIHQDGGVTLVLPNAELRVEPSKGKWHFLSDDDPAQNRGGDLPIAIPRA
jgi:hypothetical protein